MCKTCQCDRFFCKLITQFDEVSKLLRPVMLNMAMTLIAWIYVYEMKTDDRLSAMFLMSGNSTTGNQYQDGIINAFSAMMVLAVVSFSMLLLALWDCRRLVQLWLHMSCLLILFAVSGGFFYDLLKSMQINEDKIIYEFLPALVTAYGGFGCIAFFYPKAPLLLHQFYVLSNCSLVSLFYLRSFPGYTAWFVLWCVALWDIFAVLAPIGPLRKVQEKAGDYSHDVLRFLMFTADAKTVSDTTEDQQQSNDQGESESETKAVTPPQQQNESATETSSSVTVSSDESDEDVEQHVDEPLLRRRVRQTAGADIVEVVEDVRKEEDRLKTNSQKNVGKRIEKDKKSDLSSEDEVAVEMEVDVDIGDTNENDEKDYWKEKYCINDKEALSIDHHKKVLESSSSSGYSDSDSSDSTSTDVDNEEEQAESVSVTAADALNDANSLRLGMGDFVFYSVLVGQAATTGNIGATVAAALGVVYGLLITLTYFSNGDETTPALPISIVLGTVFHFIYLFVEPTLRFYTEFIFHKILYLFID
ncbi:Presenilin [Dictyocaulus viviparus]|uniref:Presenilin n=1 Tax=Dictyocaulus viviparus TaxID=29172 RepID=A0A0D8Y0B9_DICVI|nr:Presenilin [Dictyocaulus viviparus]